MVFAEQEAKKTQIITISEKAREGMIVANRTNDKRCEAAAFMPVGSPIGAEARPCVWSSPKMDNFLFENRIEQGNLMR